MNKKGFTLVELLVVIAIIGLLSTMAVVALNSARAKSRDARRISDVKQIQTALELYYNDKGGYPPANSSQISTSTTDGMTAYMATIPTPPTPNDCTVVATTPYYTYTPTSTAPYVGYSLTYCLGGTTGGVAPGLHTATPSGIQ